MGERNASDRSNPPPPKRPWLGLSVGAAILLGTGALLVQRSRSSGSEAVRVGADADPERLRPPHPDQFERPVRRRELDPDKFRRLVEHRREPSALDDAPIPSEVADEDLSTPPPDEVAHLPKLAMSPEASVIAPRPSTPDEPLEFESLDDEIDFYEAKLERAVENRDKRRDYVERLPAKREKIAEGPYPQRLEMFDRQAAIVNENYAIAQDRVAELEDKLATLRARTD